MTLSRRHFLQAVGVSVAASQFLPSLTFAAEQPLMGRVLEPVNGLWPDSVVAIRDADASRYRIDAGWVPQSALQPLLIDHTAFDGSWPAAPFSAEVSAPVAAVYASASAASQPLARVGYGGVLTVVDALPGADGRPAWLGVASGDALLGWTQAAHWQPAVAPAATPRVTALHIDLSRFRLTALHDDTTLLETAVALSPHAVLTPHSSHTVARTPHMTDHAQVGIPWVLTSQSGVQLAGATWHNRFGTPQPGPTVQLTPATAKWLYHAAIPDVTLVLA